MPGRPRTEQVGGDEPPPRFSVRGWAGIRQHRLRSTVLVGGGRSPQTLCQETKTIMKETCLVLFILTGVAIIGFCIPLIRRRIKPNSWYGFRVRRTLKDPDVWYPANEYAARRTIWVGAATILAAIIFYLFPEISFPVYATIVGVVTVVGLIVVLVQSFSFLRTLPENDSDHDPKA